MLRVDDFAFFLKFQTIKSIAKRSFTCFIWNGNVVMLIIDWVSVVERV